MQPTNAELSKYDEQLNEDALDLIQADRIIGAVIQLGRARRLVVRDLLSVLNCTTILEVSGNARCSPERMAAGRRGQATRSAVPTRDARKLRFAAVTGVQEAVKKARLGAPPSWQWQGQRRGSLQPSGRAR